MEKQTRKIKLSFLFIAPHLTRGAGAFGTQSEEFKVMPIDCKTCLNGDKLFQDREVAIATLHCFQAGAANNHMAVPRL